MRVECSTQGLLLHSHTNKHTYMYLKFNPKVVRATAGRHLLLLLRQGLAQFEALKLSLGPALFLPGAAGLALGPFGTETLAKRRPIHCRESIT